MCKIGRHSIISECREKEKIVLEISKDRGKIQGRKEGRIKI